ncbi:MAG: hypothetical protein M1828_007292 [Chrysothrix sp. TS-e1954]|nr:MAG: hypothetical protein M1828_007292 [Chrysothrix sp. TS-e1954]
MAIKEDSKKRKLAQSDPSTKLDKTRPKKPKPIESSTSKPVSAQSSDQVEIAAKHAKKKLALSVPDDEVAAKKKGAKTNEPATKPQSGKATQMPPDTKPLKSALKKTKAAPKPLAASLEPEAEASDFSDLSDSAQDPPGEDPQTAALLAGFESSSESETERPLVQDAEITSVPSIPSTASTALSTTTPTTTSTSPRTLYVGRIPHGFYEHQMRAYFAQFGTITRLRLSRNPRTGASRHYAFLEFASAEVAKIVADTMDNYLMFGHILKVRLLAPEQVHAELWKGEGRRFKRIPWRSVERGRVKSAGRETWGRRVSNEEKRRGKKRERLRELGYEFEMPSLRTVESVPVKETKAVEGKDDVKAVEGKDEVKAVEAAKAKTDENSVEAPKKKKTTKTTKKVKAVTGRAIANVEGAAVALTV